MRALLVTHGDLGEALLRSAHYIYAVQAPIRVLSNRDLDLAGLRAAIDQWLDEEPGPSLVMVDVGGGSCGTAARAAAQGRNSVRLLAGVNLPMVLTYLSSHAQLGLDELVSKMLDRALHAVAPLDPAPRQ
jgi:mannose/fructose-specific phosphotransferase system component IIA